MSVKKLALIIALALMLIPGAAFAGTIYVDNFSFETLPNGGLNYGCGGSCAFSLDSPIPGWNATGTYGQFIPGGYGGNPNAYDGSVLAYSNGGTISQTVGPEAIAGETYTLSVEVLTRTDKSQDASVQLEFGGSVCGTAPVVNAGPGTWNDFTVSCTATGAQAGDSITILLTTQGLGQGDYDDVQLSSVPEPSVLLLLTLGLLGLCSGWFGKSRTAAI